MKKILVTLALAALLFAGCSSKEKGPVDGTYSATGTGIHGEVSVEIVVEGGAIKSATVDVSGETVGYGADHQADFEEQIVKANGAEIDGVSGSTFTSNGIKEAYAKVLEEAGFTTSEE